nr:ribonuclease H-like domain-containing protein [Tanacetum cinerariifolium]
MMVIMLVFISLDSRKLGLNSRCEASLEKLAKDVVKPNITHKRYVVATGRVIVPTGRYVVPTGRAIVATGRYVVPAVAQTTTNDAGTSTTHIPGPVTNEEKAQKKNDVKAKSMLLMELPNEHLMTFNQYKDSKTLFAAIKTKFGGNEATKKTLLKQLYENFSATSTESLDLIFNRLQKIVSQLAVLSVFISQEYLNLKFSRGLLSEWNTHVMVWRNKFDLDTMSINDLYNNFKIVKQEVKGTTSTNLNSQNIDFVSSPSPNSTNKVPTDFGVNTASPQVSTANLSDATMYASLANQPNGYQVIHEDLEQIHEDDLEEIDLKLQLALLSMRAKSQIIDKSMRGLGYVSYNAIPPPDTKRFSPPRINLSHTGLPEFAKPGVKSYGFKPIEVVTQTSSVKISEPVKNTMMHHLLRTGNQKEKIRLNLLLR